MAMIIAWFETDDIFQRVSILFLLACLFGYTTNIVEAFSHTYATLIGFYLAARLYMTAYLALVAWLVPMVRPVMLYYATASLLNAAFDRVDYFAIRDAATLNPVRDVERPSRALAAAWLGKTRLIDNIAV